MLIAGYQFSEPKSLDGTNWKQVPAVYVVLDRGIEKYRVVDVGETDKLKDRLANHERRPCWERNCNGKIFIAAKVERSESARQRIEGEIRKRYNPPCGKE